MALLLSAREPIRHKPAGSQTAYLLQPPTPYSWAAMRRAVRARGAVQHSAWDMARVARDGVAALLAGPDNAADLAARLADLDAYVTALDGVSAAGAPPEAMTEFAARLARYAEIATLVRRAWPPFAELEADNEYHAEIQAIEAVRAHQIGAGGRVTDDELAAIPQRDLYDLWRAILEARAPTDTERKNSGSPSPGSGGAEISTGPAPSVGP